ncbi:MAG: rhodanese-like domain-containing protein [Planctomycetota bacterium]
MLRTLLECVALVAATAVIGLIWNGASGKGLTLTRDYFQRIQPPKIQKTDIDVTPKDPVKSAEKLVGVDGADVTAPGTQPGNDVAVSTVEEPGPDEKPKDGTISGLQALSLEDAMLFAEKEMQDLVAFLDARTRDNYEEAHIPGAYHLYTYQAEKQIEALRADLADKEILIVYCGGGDCEDSVTLASMMINEFGYGYEKVWVYEGGLEEWQKAGNPVTTGGSRE